MSAIEQTRPLRLGSWPDAFEVFADMAAGLVPVPRRPVWVERGRLRYAPDPFSTPAEALEYVAERYPTARLHADGSGISATWTAGGNTYIEHFTLKPAL